MLKRILLLVVITLIVGCQNAEQPRLRVSSYFGSVGAMSFPEADHLGRHNYDSQWSEKNGMLYTCRGGFIDMGHLREAADRTWHAATLIEKSILDGKTEVLFRLIEPSQYRLSIVYPAGWKLMTQEQRQTMARDVAQKFGQQVGHTSLVWHEIITWFGFASTGLFSEQISSFSWEDTYSDVLGTALAVKAMQQNKPFEEAMTDLIYQTLQDLEVRPPDVARTALKQIEGQWFEGGFYFFVKMNKRHFDIGLDSGEVVPWLVPGICPGSQPLACRVPRPSPAELQGFGFELTLNPKVHEQKKIYQLLALHKDQWLTPARDFPLILDKIMQQAKKESGPQVDEPYSRHMVLRTSTLRQAEN